MDKSIYLFDFRIVNSDVSTLFKLFPGILVNFLNFKQVRSRVFKYNDVCIY